MPKFFVADKQIQNNMINIVGEDVNHIINVLRLKKEDEILVCNRDKEITYNTKIIDLQKEMIICQIIEKVNETTESNIKVTIFQGLPKADKMEYIIQKGTELGVTEIIPVAMKRCVVKLEGKDVLKKVERWQKISEVAAKQSGRDMIPQIKPLIDMKQLKDMVSDFDLMIVAYEEEKEITLKHVLRKIQVLSSNVRIGVVIGPEGGLEKQDVEELKEKGATIVTLGRRILRTETASLTILSNIMYELEMQ